MSRSLRGALAAAAFPALLAGCDTAAVSDEVTVRDSAGVTIVENAASAAVPEWSIGAPTVSIGDIGQGEPYELYEPLHGLRLDDGRIVLANQGTRELRIFDPEGRHLRTVGRAGGGPGEFQAMWGLVRLPGDSLGIWDWTAKRLTIYDDEGNFARLVTTAGEAGGFAPRLAGAFDDGTFVVLDGFDPTAVFGSGGGVREDSLALLRYDLDGQVVDSLGPYPGPARYVHLGETGFWMRPVKFGRGEHLQVAAGRVFFGDDRTAEVRAFDRDGRLLRIVRLPHDPRAVTTDHLARYRDQFLEGVPEDQLAQARERLEETPAADRLPAFDDLFVDRLGRLWVEEFDGFTDRPDVWTVLGPDGRLLARLTLPPAVRPLDAGEDYLLTYERDDLDVEHVRLHPLRSEPPTG
ncbi:MAG TPA: 6-bladed beta-propeller [Longimicrobiales bacterium]|nr:6-bladed beta-propeller [Longimicrobiales bacterium]